MDDLCQHVRRDDSLTAMARLLFYEIYEMWDDEGQCFAGNEWLAKQIGGAPSSVRRWKRQLREAGYIKECHTKGKRYLSPNPGAIRSDRGDQKRSDADQEQPENDQQQTEASTDDREGAISSDQDLDVDNPAEAEESAPAREDGTEGKPQQQDQSPEERFGVLVDVWRSVRSAPPLTEKIEDVLWDWAQDGTIDDLDLFEEVLQEQAADTTAKGSGMSMGILLKEYRKRRNAGKLTPKQQKDDDYSINEDGEPCFKGTPFSEIGPQNYYDEIERKDGSNRPEPEVSAA